MLKKASPLGLFVCLFIDVVYTRGQWSLSFRTSSASWRWLQGQEGVGSRGLTWCQPLLLPYFCLWLSSLGWF